jgi:quercetin dioxygenase-like cupin family protein
MTTEGYADDGTILKEFAQFDLAQEMMDSERTKPWAKGHTARTLFKKTDFRMVLISMEKGAVLNEHHADGTISVQVLKGSIRFISQGEAHTLRQNSIVTLGPSISHQVEAIEEAAFLLTIAWPDKDKLRTMQHRGYGT